MGYSRKKNKQGEGGGGLRTYFFENPVGIFCLFISLLEIPDKSKVHPWKLCKTVLHPSEIPRPKITTPGNSTCYFFNIYIPPGNSISSTPPPVLFFSGITQCKEGVFFFSFDFGWYFIHLDSVC